MILTILSLLYGHSLPSLGSKYKSKTVKYSVSDLHIEEKSMIWNELTIRK